MLVVVCIIFIALPLYGQTPIRYGNEQSQDDKKISQTQNKSTNKKSPINQTLIPSQNLQKETTDKKANCQYPPKNWRDVLNNPTDCFTGIIAIFTLCLFMAAAWHVVIAIRAARRQLRAYVFIKEVRIENVTGPPPVEARLENDTAPGPWVYYPSKGPIVTMAFKNFGQTPAYEVLHGADLCSHEFPLIGNSLPLQTKPDISQVVTKVAMPPSGEGVKILTMEKPLTPEEVKQLEVGKTAIYLYGEITYRDAFRKKRSTKYRYMYNGLTGTVGKTNAMTGCEEGNEAD